MVAMGISSTGRLPCSEVSKAKMLTWLDNQTDGACSQKEHAPPWRSWRYSAKSSSISATSFSLLAGNTQSLLLHSSTMHTISCSIIFPRDGLVGSLLVKLHPWFRTEFCPLWVFGYQDPLPIGSFLPKGMDGKSSQLLLGWYSQFVVQWGKSQNRSTVFRTLVW
jgi:hypothetical protein